MRRSCLAILCAAALSAVLADVASARKPERILLKDVQVLSFYKGKWSTSRRGNPVPQVKCIGGDACSMFVPEVIQCKNMGWDGQDVSWRCTAEMDEAFRFGETTVACEGYSNPDDPYILAGSCGVEYTLHLTQKGKEWQARGRDYGYQQHQQPRRDHYQEDSSKYEDPSSSSGGLIGNLIFYGMMAFFAYTLYGVFFGPRDRNHGNGRGPSGGGGPPGGGGSGGPRGPPGDDPRGPPPSYPSDGKSGSSSSSYEPPPPYSPYGSTTSGYGAGTRTQTGGSAFGTAGTLLAGAVAGGLLNSIFNRNRNADQQQQARQGYTRTQFGQTRGSSWTGASSSSSSSSGGYTGTSHTSAGYGGTRRR